MIGGTFMANYKRFSLLNILFSVLNSSQYSSLDHFLAQYFIDNFQNLKELNIHDIASQCYCTRQSVRRFCNKIGFQNFADFKNYPVRYKHIQWEHLNRLNQDNFKDSLTAGINDALNNICKKIDLGELDEVAQLIHECDNVIFLIDDSLKSLVSSFQKSMIYCDKIVKIISNTFGGDNLLEYTFEANKKYDNRTLDSMGEEDLIIVISMTGNFARVMDEVISQLESQNILITVNQRQKCLSSYDKIYSLCDEDHAHEGINAYSMYGINFYLDNLFNIYFKKYGNQSLLNDKSEPI